MPPAGATPAVSAELAYRSCDVDGTCVRGVAPDIEIASVTVPDVKDVATGRTLYGMDDSTLAAAAAPFR